MNVYFSEIFNVNEDILDEYGAFNISLITDLPLFIDPFLLFNSKNPNYQRLHERIIRYLIFLRDKSTQTHISEGLLRSWYHFSEVEQNWLGFCIKGNRGRGLGSDFATALNENLNKLFPDFGEEKITNSSHLEKLCIIKKGVGRDTISDFTTNLIKDFLIEYTESFAQQHIDSHLMERVAINRVRFNFETQSWETGYYNLPFYNSEFVILTPRDILTKDDTWINKRAFYRDFYRIPTAIPNEQLRAQVDNYFRSILPRKPTKKDEESAIAKTALKFPELIDYFIKFKEDTGDEAEAISINHVRDSRQLYVKQFSQLISLLSQESEFYKYGTNTHEETYKRIIFLKDVIENKGGYRIFYNKGEPIRKEEDLQILYRLTWYASPSDVSREVNDGRGPVDFKVSRGAKDKTLVEMKLASNSQLKRNLKNQVPLYQKASDAEYAYKVIIYFTRVELSKVEKILRELKLTHDDNVILIDARKDNKPSASKA